MYISLLIFYLPFYFPILDSLLVLLVTFWLFRKINKNFAFCARALISLVVRYFDEAKGEWQNRRWKILGDATHQNDW